MVDNFKPTLGLAYHPASLPPSPRTVSKWPQKLTQHRRRSVNSQSADNQPKLSTNLNLTRRHSHPIRIEYSKDALHRGMHSARTRFEFERSMVGADLMSADLVFCKPDRGALPPCPERMVVFCRIVDASHSPSVFFTTEPITLLALSRLAEMHQHASGKYRMKIGFRSKGMIEPTITFSGGNYLLNVL
jgi:hypothetical protein